MTMKNNKNAINLGNKYALKKPEERKNNIFTVRVNDDLAKRLRTAAAADTRTISNFIELLITKGVKHDH